MQNKTKLFEKYFALKHLLNCFNTVIAGLHTCTHAAQDTCKTKCKNISQFADFTISTSMAYSSLI